MLESDSYYVLGLDIGGTKMRAAIADMRGDLLAEARMRTVKYQGQPNYGEIFTHLRNDLIKRSYVDGTTLGAVGVSVAGIVDPITGYIVMAPNTTVQEDFDLRTIIENELNLPVLIDNDVNLAAVGEHWKGAAQGCNNFIFVAIGTGVGAGIFVNGRLYHGAHNAAGRLGHLYVQGSEVIEAGTLGALERHASGAAIAEAVRERLKHRSMSSQQSELAKLDVNRLTSEDVWAAAAQGDQLALNVLNEVFDTLALGLANAALLLDPELIVLGGGVSSAGDALLIPLRERLSALLMHPIAPRIELSQLGSIAQLYGAVYYALKHVSPQ
jgi:glucokinase